MNIENYSKARDIKSSIDDKNSFLRRIENLLDCKYLKCNIEENGASKMGCRINEFNSYNDTLIRDLLVKEKVIIEMEVKELVKQFEAI